MNDVITLWQEVLGEMGKEDGGGVGLTSEVETSNQLKGEPEASPGRELHADQLLSQIVEMLAVGHSDND